MKIQSDLIGNYKKQKIKNFYDNINGENKQLIQSSFADLNYNLASEACQNRQTVNQGVRDIIDNNNNNMRSILDFLVQNKIDTLSAENTALRGQISQSEQNAYLVSQLGQKAPQPCYVVANPYSGTTYNTCPGCVNY